MPAIACTLLADMGVEPDAVLAREIAAGAQESVRAMVRDGRRDRGADVLARPAPVLQHAPHGVERALPRRQAQPIDLGLQPAGKAS